MSQSSRRDRLRRKLVVWAPRVGAIALVILAFWVGLRMGSPAASDASADRQAEHGEGAKKPSLWTCSMHPQIKMPTAGSCPICGMDLIPVGG